MSRFIDVLLIAVYALVAAASAAALIQYGGLDGPFAWLAGFQVFLVMGLIQTMTARRVEHRRMDELIAFTNSISRDLEIAEEKLGELDTAVSAGDMPAPAARSEAKVEEPQPATQPATQPAPAERTPEKLDAHDVHGLQARVSALAGELDEQHPQQSARKETAGTSSSLNPAPETGAPSGPGEARPALQLVTSETDGPLADDGDLLDMIHEALEKNRLDLYLQPIVNLPQRQTCFYEGLTRLRGPRGEVIMPDDYIRVAEPAGLMPIVDNMLLLRCVQVVRQMSRRGKDAAIFCNISAHTLGDTEFFPQFIEYMHDNEELAGKIVFEISQETMLNAGALELENLRELAQLGFRLSMDRVKHLRMDFGELKILGFRFIKIEASLLLQGVNGLSDFLGDIHGSDLKEFLRRTGMTLIAERIEEEHTVLDLLDFDMDYGQGFLFARPRPVRKDMMAA